MYWQSAGCVMASRSVRRPRMRMVFGVTGRPFEPQRPGGWTTAVNVAAASMAPSTPKRPFRSQACIAEESTVKRKSADVAFFIR